MFWRKKCALCGSTIRKTFSLTVKPGLSGAADLMGRVAQLRRRKRTPNEIGTQCKQCGKFYCFQCIMGREGCPACGKNTLK